jgi:hypothetical protein
MLSMAENPAMLSMMGASARERVNELFSSDRLYCALKEMYLDCAVEHKSTRD